MVLRDDILKKELAEQIADYVATNNRYDEMGRREAIIEAVWVLTNDIGAAQKFLQAIGLNIDLYTYDFVNQRPKSRIKIVNDPDTLLADFAKNLIRVEVSGDDITGTELKHSSASPVSGHYCDIRNREHFKPCGCICANCVHAQQKPTIG